MTDLYSLIKETNAFKTVSGDKKNQRLSHAYLILTADKVNLGEYLKIFAKLMVCESVQPCDKCRACKLISQGAYADVITYPQSAANINTEDITALIEESYLKPIECEKKIFILNNAQDMNAVAQNKLLKTLEEPPQNVHIIIGATSEFSLLSTVKSRVKKLEIPTFSKEKLFEVLSEDYPDKDKLSVAIACCDGTVGNAILLYADEKLKEINELCVEIIVNMKSSKDLLKYSTKVINSKCDIQEFLSVMDLLFRDMLVAKDNEKLIFNTSSFSLIKNNDYSTGALLHALDKITEAQKRKKFNANPTMLIEWVLFQILEGKYKWQKL